MLHVSIDMYILFKFMTYSIITFDDLQLFRRTNPIRFLSLCFDIFSERVLRVYFIVCTK